MGWNGVRDAAAGSSLPSFWSLGDGDKVYFVHSYRATPSGSWTHATVDAHTLVRLAVNANGDASGTAVPS